MLYNLRIYSPCEDRKALTYAGIFGISIYNTCTLLFLHTLYTIENMINSAKADNIRRKAFYKSMCRLHFYKYITHNQNIPLNIRYFYKEKIKAEGSFFVKIRNRCIITGRGRGVYRFCKLSRGFLQEKALNGQLIGFSKSSW